MCGNHVVEAGEECDGFPKGVCHNPGTPQQCRINCQMQACAPGAGCGADAVCRVPSGEFSSNTLGSEQVGLFTAADVNADGRTDLLVRGSTSLSATTFSQERVLRVTGTVPLPMSRLVTGELNADKRTDMVTFMPATGEEAGDNSVRVIFADGAGVPTTVSLLAPTPSGHPRTLLSADEDGDGALDPLMLVDGTLWRVPPRGFAPFKQLLKLQVDLETTGLLSRMAVADFDRTTRCSEIAIAPWQGAIQLYSLCAADSAAALITQIQLPPERQVSYPGVFAGDVDGDGREDLIVPLLPPDDLPEPEYREMDVVVAYGRGDGSFHSAPLSDGLPADNTTSSEPLSLAPTGVIAVGELDGDGRSDFVLWDRIVLSSKAATPCRSQQDFSCGRALREEWMTAAVADFTRDGIPDLLGAPWGVQELTFLLGLSGGGLNQFSIPIPGFVEGFSETGHELSVGDYDGDQTPDVAFAQNKGLGNSGATLTVLYGSPFEPPSAMREFGIVPGVADLCAGQLHAREDSLSDLVMLAYVDPNYLEQETPEVGVGLFAGQTNRLMFSPLGVPEASDTSGKLELEDVALGRFHREDGKPAPSDDLIMLAKHPSDARLLYYLANTKEGFDTGNLAARARLVGAKAGVALSLATLDLDGDGLEEVIVYPNEINQGRLTYWVAQNQAKKDGEVKFVVSPLAVEVRGLPARVVTSIDDELRRHKPRDVNGDGRADLLLAMSTPEDDDSIDPYLYYEIVFPGAATGRLEPGTAFATGESNDADYLNIDADPELELAVALYFDAGPVKVYDLDFAKPALINPVPIQYTNSTWILEAGDFDGDGVEDLAVLGDTPSIFWGEARKL